MKRRPVEIRKSTRTFLTCSYAILLTNHSHIVVEARSWWSLEIPALDAIRNEDPLYAPSSALLMEDNSFMYGGSSGFVEDHIESSSQNFNHLTIGLPMSSNPTLGNESSYHMVEHVPNKVPSKVPSKVSTASPSVTAYGKINEDEQPTYSSPEQYDAAIGSCPPNHTLYLLWLYDLVGDGWGSTKLAIKETSAASNSEDTIFVGSLDASNRVVKYEAGKQRRGLGVTLSERILGPSGSILGLAQGFADTPPDEGISSAKGFANGLEYGKGEGNERNDGNQTSSNAQYLCLKPDVCYTAKVSGGTSLEEARWEVTRVKLLGTEVNIGSAVAEGVGTGAGVCNFSLGDSCAKTCDGELLCLSMFVVYLHSLQHHNCFKTYTKSHR